MKNLKRCIVLFGIFLTVVLVSGFLHAQSSNQSVVDDALSCVEDQASNGSCSNFGLEDKVFSALSAGQCVKELKNSSNNNCFGVGGCSPKHTAQAILALDRANVDVEDYENWLRSTNSSSPNLNWYMQIESRETSCTINDLSGTQYQVSVDEEKNISLNNNQGCFSVSSNGYWLEVDSACSDQEFEVSCQDDFSTSMLFQKQGSPTVYVTEEIHTASSGGTVIEKAEESSCLTSGGACSYEGTLWGVLALKELGYDVSQYLPYLTAFAEDNEQYLPESFLYTFTSNENYRSELLLKQKADRYWSESGNRFYDTAVAMMPFAGETLDSKSNAIDWLESEQGSNGCWNQGSVANTGFLLYSIWPSELPSVDFSSDGGGGGGNNTDPDDSDTGLQDCEVQGNYCVNEVVCSEQNGSQLEGFSCDGYGFGKVCCDQPAPNETCSELGGEICGSSETCDGVPDSSASDIVSGETCCIGSCSEESSQPAGDCEPNGGNCRLSGCKGGESQSSLYQCSSEDATCCTPDEDEGEGSVAWWIFVLIALIILVVLAIVFREKLKKIYLSFKSKGHTRSGPRKRPPGMPPGKPPAAPPKKRPPAGPGPRKRPPMKKKGPSPGKKKEIDEVMGKLKKMGS